MHVFLVNNYWTRLSVIRKINKVEVVFSAEAVG